MRGPWTCLFWVLKWLMGEIVFIFSIGKLLNHWHIHWPVDGSVDMEVDDLSENLTEANDILLENVVSYIH